MNVLSLFSGIGGLELGLERAGMTTVGQVELNPYCNEVLAHHWPEVPRHDDARTASEWWGTEPRPRVDLVCGGFPCQDISSANVVNRVGLSGPKSGLWTAFADVVESIQPGWVIVENSPNWQQWTPVVRSDLHDLGYDTAALRLSAGSFGAPHRRPRVVVVAHTYSEGQSLRTFHEEVARLRPVSRGDGHWAHQPRPMGVADGVPDRMDRLRALGNAVVPQVAEHIGRLIVAHQDSPES